MGFLQENSKELCDTSKMIKSIIVWIFMDWPSVSSDEWLRSFACCAGLRNIWSNATHLLLSLKESLWREQRLNPHVSNIIYLCGCQHYQISSIPPSECSGPDPDISGRTCDVREAAQAGVVQEWRLMRHDTTAPLLALLQRACWAQS